ncbi:unnamed protein product [Porites evermanni]|uniref:Uncharacterized protein n=1 Tax=Porites evermanni TaxID=104178 RepID=A0ABN8LXZ9_9CNID|nr:unnamed protein product [Porites evermanni]
MPTLRTEYYGQDNAGCYRSSGTITGVIQTRKSHTVTVQRLNLSSPQSVISSLTSPIKDQVMNLTYLSITAICLDDITTVKRCKQLQNREYSVIFESPELRLGDKNSHK